MTLTFRHATPEDAPLLAAAEQEIAKKPGFFCSQPGELTVENVKQTISSFLQDKKGIYLVAEQEGRIVAHGFLEPHHLQSLRHIADLNIAVHPSHLGKGIGTQLMQQLIIWAKNTGLEKIELHVRSTNTKAVSLYKKMGFKEEGRLKKRVKIKSGYLDDLIMGLDLTSPPIECALRLMQENDIEALVKNFCFPWDTPQGTKEKWKRYFEDSQRSVYLLEYRNQIIGYGCLQRMSEYSYFREANIPEICDVWIHEERRGKGFGTRLISHLENVALKEGYTVIGIGVGLYRDYGPAQKLYFQLGYVPDGQGITYKTAQVTPGEQYPFDDDLILWMTKQLF